MTFDIEKSKNGTNLFYSVEILPNKCKFTTDAAIQKGTVSISSALTDSYTGPVPLSGGDLDFFKNSNPYLKINDEIMGLDLPGGSGGLALNGTDQQVNIPSITMMGDYEVEIIFSQPRSQFPSGYLLSHASDFNLRVQSSTDLIVIDHPTTTVKQALNTTLTVQSNQTNTLRIKKTSSTVRVKLNNVEESFFNLNFTDPSIDTIGRRVSGSGFFNGRILSLKVWTGGSEQSGTLERNYPFDDTFSNNPTIRDTASSQDGTAINATTASWDNSVNITSRGEFSTTATSHAAGPATILHPGEADGTCLGFPRLPNGGGCSSGDSFDRDIELSYLFTSQKMNDGTKYYNGLNVDSISHSPVKIAPGESIGKRATFSCTITDSTDNDVDSVPYSERRTSKATLFKKLLARHPHLENRRLIYTSGFIKDGNLSVNTREYVIDSASLSNGVFRVSAVDPLILAESSKAKLPKESTGSLEVALNNASTTIKVKGFTVGEYGSDGDAITVKIDKELISCTISDAAAGLFNITSRAVKSIEAEHNTNSTVQLCIKLENFNPVSTIEDFLKAGTTIKASFYDGYTSAKAQVLNGTGPVYISTPTPVKTLVNEIIKTWAANGLAVYFDEIEKKIKIKSSSDFSQQPVTLDYKVDLENGKSKIDRNVKNQFTRSKISFARIDEGEKVSEENSSISFNSIALDTEVSGLLESNAKKDFTTRFLTNSDNDVQIAVAGVNRIVNTNKEIPSIHTFNIDYENYRSTKNGIVEEAEIINVITDEECNEDGSDKSINVQILSLKDNAPTPTFTVTCQKYQDIIQESDFDFIIDEDKEDYDLSTEFAPASPGEYTVFIKSGVTIGATSTAVNAFTTGTQAAGVTFKITHRGSILSAGGRGADGPWLDLPGFFDAPIISDEVSGRNGNNGGTSVSLTVDCEIDTSQGVIYAGGGGAPSTKSEGGNTVDGNNPEPHGNAGNGGSGGQGYSSSPGGDAGTVTVDGSGVVDTAVDGSAGSRSAPGILANISGGAWGEDSDETPNTGNKGLSGFAIKSNGNSVIITGDNNLTVRGRRS